MQNEQNLKEKSVENNHKSKIHTHFDIRYDTGNLYTPGKIVVLNTHTAIYCRNNCGAEFVAEGVHYQLQRGDMVLIRAGTPHGFVSYSKGQDAYAGFVVSSSEAYAEMMSQQIGIKKLPNNENSLHIRTRGTLWERIEDMFLLCLEELELKAPGWETALFGSSMVLLVQIARAGASDPNASARLDKPELLTGILAYVENNLQEKITLEDLSSRFFVSASTITHLFAKKMDTSFHKYVMQRRLNKAKDLIREGKPMEKVAAFVGFGDYSAFYRAFKQEFGLSPRQFFKDAQEQN